LESQIILKYFGERVNRRSWTV